MDPGAALVRRQGRQDPRRRHRGRHRAGQRRPGLRHLSSPCPRTAAGWTPTSSSSACGRELPDSSCRHALIGLAQDGRLAYDALHDPELTRLAAARHGRPGGAGPAAASPPSPGADLDTGLDSLVLTGEQSNTSLIFGEDSHPQGVPPAVPRAQPRPGGAPARWPGAAPRTSPQPLGWIETTLGGAPAVLAILSSYLRAATDGWSLAATSVRDLYAERDRERGRRPAATSPARRTGSARPPPRYTATWPRRSASTNCPPEAISRLADEMFHRLDVAVAAVPELRQHADLLGAAFSDLAKLDGSLAGAAGARRLPPRPGAAHRRPAGWCWTSRASRRSRWRSAARPRSALRDVAGMLRSFDYAARHQLLAAPDAGPAARGRAGSGSSATRPRSAPGTPRRAASIRGTHAVLLRALILDKAVYEVMYEARHRPAGCRSRSARSPTPER